MSALAVAVPARLMAWMRRQTGTWSRLPDRRGLKRCPRAAEVLTGRTIALLAICGAEVLQAGKSRNLDSSPAVSRGFEF